MKKNQSGFSLIESLLVVIILGILSGAGWYVWSSNKKANDTLDRADKSTSIETRQIAEPLSLDESKLPAGWSLERKNPNYMEISNKDSQCFASVTYTTDTAESNSPDVDHNKQTVEAIESKGYTVEESFGKLTIVTNGGEKQIDAQMLQVTGMDNPMSQIYAHIPKSDSYTEVQLSCPDKAGLTSAQSALLAIKLKKIN